MDDSEIQVLEEIIKSPAIEEINQYSTETQFLTPKPPLASSSDDSIEIVGEFTVQDKSEKLPQRSGRTCILVDNTVQTPSTVDVELRASSTRMMRDLLRSHLPIHRPFPDCPDFIPLEASTPGEKKRKSQKRKASLTRHDKFVAKRKMWKNYHEKKLLPKSTGVSVYDLKGREQEEGLSVASLSETLPSYSDQPGPSVVPEQAGAPSLSETLPSYKDQPSCSYAVQNDLIDISAEVSATPRPRGNRTPRFKKSKKTNAANAVAHQRIPGREEKSNAGKKWKKAVRRSGQISGPSAPVIDRRLQGRPLRPIVIDGANVGYRFSRKMNKNYLNFEGISLIYDYFVKRGHSVSVVLAQTWESRCVKEPCMQKVFKADSFVFTPHLTQPGFNQLKLDDDRFVVQLAADRQGVIVSADFYRDLIESAKRDNLTEWVVAATQRLLIPTFAGGSVMFDPRPYGENGPLLDELLRF